MQVIKQDRCELCGDTLRSRHVTHTNIQSNPIKHHFCNKKCKSEFCDAVHRNDGKIKGWNEMVKK